MLARFAAVIILRRFSEDADGLVQKNLTQSRMHLIERPKVNSKDP